MGANSHTNYALRKNGQQEITPIHPELAEPLEPILGTTYGLIVYQEQVMAIAQKLAGYTLGKADLLRRAMGKKKHEVLDAEFVGFAEGMAANGYSTAAIKTLWDILVPFSDYAFNKAHSAAYGLVSYWTAYLKANYPAEYMAALLTSVRDDKDKSALYLNECRRMGIKVLPPDVNESLGQLHRRRHRHPLRPRRDPQRRRQRRRRRSSRRAQDKGRFTSLQRLPAQGRRGGLQQADHRVADQGRRVRLARHTRQGLVAVHEDDVDAVRRHQAQGGHRPDSPVRRLRRRRRRRRLGRLRGAAADPDGRVGQADAARLRARDARPLRLRPPAVRHRARPRPARRHLDRRADRRRRQARRHERHDRPG